MNAIAIEVKAPTTYGSREAAQAIIDGFGGPDCVIGVKLNTREQVPDIFEESENWPVRLQCISDREGMEEFEIRILMMTSGYNGAEPHDLVELLSYAGFDFDENQIFEETINECWSKDE